MDPLKHCIIDFLLSLEAQFHLGRVDIDIDLFTVHMEMQYSERELMLHGKIPVGIFQRFGDHGAFHVASVHKKVLKIPVAPRDHRLPEIAADAQAPFFIVNIKQVCGHVTAVHLIDHIFQFSAPRRAELLLPVADEQEGNFRMGQGQMDQQVLDVSGFCHRRLQELPPCRHIIKELAHKEGGAVRRAGLLQRDLFPALDHIAGAQFGIRRLRDQFGLRHGRDA